MQFYKAIKDNTFIGVATSQNFGKYYKKKNGQVLMLVSEPLTAQYLLIDNEWYHATWLCPETEQNFAQTIDIIEISEDEYNTLVAAIEQNTPIEIIPEVPSIEEEVPDTDPQIGETATIDFIRQQKILEMSRACNAAIVAGADVKLSDGKIYHFSLTIEDQMNLVSLAALLTQGYTAIPYHADGEMCVFYSVEDFTTITEKCTAWKIYHESYFNSLRNYINSLDDFNVIAAIYYGVEIPAEYQSTVLQTLKG